MAQSSGKPRAAGMALRKASRATSSSRSALASVSWALICASARALAPGESLFKQGAEAADEMYLIRRGRVRIELDIDSGGHRLLAVFARGDFFGEMAFLDHGRRAASAEALAPTELFALSRSRFDAAAVRDPELGRQLFSRLPEELPDPSRLGHRDRSTRTASV